MVVFHDKLQMSAKFREVVVHVIFCDNIQFL